MSHSLATLDAAQTRATTVLNMLHGQPGDDHVAQFWAENLEAALDAPRGGTLKAWMESHHDEVVDTLQVTMRSGEGDQWFITERWTPGARRVDAARATRVLLDGSTRDYAGVTTMAVTERVYVGFSKWGRDAVQMLVYVR